MGSRVIGKCVEKAGDLQAGILLVCLIHYLHGHTRLQGKKRWVAHSRDEYMSEIGFSLGQYNRALKILKSADLIEWEQHRYHKRPVTHLRLAADTEIWAREEGLLAAEVETIREPDPAMEKLMRVGRQARRSSERRSLLHWLST